MGSGAHQCRLMSCCIDSSAVCFIEGPTLGNRLGCVRTDRGAVLHHWFYTFPTPTSLWIIHYANELLRNFKGLFNSCSMSSGSSGAGSGDKDKLTVMILAESVPCMGPLIQRLSWGPRVWWADPCCSATLTCECVKGDLRKGRGCKLWHMCCSLSLHVSNTLRSLCSFTSESVQKLWSFTLNDHFMSLCHYMQDIKWHLFKLIINTP